MQIAEGMARSGHRSVRNASIGTLLWEQVWRVTVAKGELKSGIPKLNSAFAGDTNFSIRIMRTTVAERLCRGKGKIFKFGRNLGDSGFSFLPDRAFLFIQ
jgi:hypothetical protein